MTKRCLHTLLCLDTSLAVASGATAKSIALPHCDDAVSGNAETLWTDFQNGQRLIALTDAQEKMAVGLVDCSNGVGLEVPDRMNWFDGPGVAGVTISDRPAQVREFVEYAVRSERTHTWDDAKHTFSDAGYGFKVGKFSPENCGCSLS